MKTLEQLAHDALNELDNGPRGRVATDKINYAAVRHIGAGVGKDDIMARKAEKAAQSKENSAARAAERRDEAKQHDRDEDIRISGDAVLDLIRNSGMGAGEPDHIVSKKDTWTYHQGKEVAALYVKVMCQINGARDMGLMDDDPHAGDTEETFTFTIHRDANTPKDLKKLHCYQGGPQQKLREDVELDEARRPKGPTPEQIKANAEEWSKIEAHWRKTKGPHAAMPSGPAGDQRVRQHAIDAGIVKEDSLDEAKSGSLEHHANLAKAAHEAGNADEKAKHMANAKAAYHNLIGLSGKKKTASDERGLATWRSLKEDTEDLDESSEGRSEWRNLTTFGHSNPEVKGKVTLQQHRSTGGNRMHRLVGAENGVEVKKGSLADCMSHAKSNGWKPYLPGVKVESEALDLDEAYDTKREAQKAAFNTGRHHMLTGKPSEVEKWPQQHKKHYEAGFKSKGPLEEGYFDKEDHSSHPAHVYLKSNAVKRVVGDPKKA
jgi:hypothetical protein